MKLDIKEVLDANTLMEFCHNEGFDALINWKPVIGKYILEVNKLGANYKPTVIFSEVGEDLNSLITDFAKVWDNKYAKFYKYMDTLTKGDKWKR